MNYKNIIFTQHAFLRMFSRSITPDLVKKAIRQGEIIENYPDDNPHPSFLILFMDGKDILHVVASLEDMTKTCFVITVYHPDPEIWNQDFRTRRSK